MMRIAALFFFSASAVVAGQDPRLVAEAAISAWSSPDGKSLLALVHPELIARLRNARLIQDYVADKVDKKRMLISGSDADVIALFCETLRVWELARDAKYEGFHRYVGTKIKGDLAIVMFDFFLNRKSDGSFWKDDRMEFVLKRSGDDWRYLWSTDFPPVIDFRWDPRYTSTAPDMDPIMDISEVTLQPIGRYIARPIYPEALAEKKVPGVVEIEFVVLKDGHVSDVSIISGTNQLFGEAAAAAVARWTYKPASVDGKPVNCRLMFPIFFDMTDEVTSNLPNQLPDPTSPPVTPPAGAGGAPPVAADH
jgi:TonB family protein